MFDKGSELKKYRMKNRIYFIIFTLFIFSACKQNNQLVSFQSNDLILGIDSKGFITYLTNVNSNQNYISTDTIAPLLSCRVDGEILYPMSASVENETLLLQFPQDLEIKIECTQNDSHITFELIECNHPEKVELIVWGPIPTTISKIVGETVGVVRGDEYALGIQALNPKTLGGYPWTDNDCMPQIDIFEQSDLSDLSEKNKRGVLYRLEAAKPEKFGSTLQAYCRNRFKERIISNLNHEKYVSPVFDDGGIIGSKIALFGCPVEKTLETLGQIEIVEGLPHPTIDGKWGKETHTASAAYLIYDFNEKNIDEAIAYTKKAGLRYLYHPGPFKTWGHFDLNEEAFPHGWDGLKMCVEKAKKAGLFVGVHTLSNFITTNDPYVTPIPDPRLAKVGSSSIAEDIDKLQTDIPIESPGFFNQYKNNNLHTVMLGTELIRYDKVTETAPWKLLNCQRGAWGTEAAPHGAGAEIDMLTDHGYKVFLTNPELSEEVAEQIAKLFNYCGLQQISFDGLEGNRSTGMGNYGEILFTTTWWNNLDSEITKHTIIDASRTSHYFWHIYSRMNWGEPWYAGFRESQTEYRLKNQAYFQRNLMPGMLGWFSMRNNTPVEDIEWMLARSAAFNAGYAFVSGSEQFKTNGQSVEILRLIGEWEKARMSNAFTVEQKEQMKDINNEYHLEPIDEKHWNLYPVYSFKFSHEDKVKQPGEPLFSTFTFENQEENRTMNFILTAQNATVSNIKMELDNSRDITLPITLSAGESAHYSGGENVDILNPTLHKIRTVKINSTLMKLAMGSHSIQFDCTFSKKEKAPVAKLEIRIPGKPEKITGS